MTILAYGQYGNAKAHTWLLRPTLALERLLTAPLLILLPSSDLHIQ